MCKVGDILLIYNAKNQGKPVGPHQFIVLDDEAGTVRSMDYDIITTIMSSMLTDKKKEKYDKYEANLSILEDDRNVSNDNRNPAFTKLDQFFFFNLKFVKYKVIGTVNPDVMELINDYINELQEQGIQFYQITENLKKNQNDYSEPRGGR